MSCVTAACLTSCEWIDNQFSFVVLRLREASAAAQPSCRIRRPYLLNGGEFPELREDLRIKFKRQVWGQMDERLQRASCAWFFLLRPLCNAN